MKRWLLLAVIAVLGSSAAARAEMPVEAGQWEKTEKVTVDGQEQSGSPKKICLKKDEASLERLLLMSDDEAKARGCKIEAAPAKGGIARMSMGCPASDEGPAMTVNLEVKFSANAFEGSGTVEIKPKDGAVRKGMSKLSGKRLGDC